MENLITITFPSSFKISLVYSIEFTNNLLNLYMPDDFRCLELFSVGQVTCGYFQMMEQLASPLPQQYSTLAKDNKQSEIGKQFAEFIKLQQTTSKKATTTRYTFEPYVADDRYKSSCEHFVCSRQFPSSVLSNSAVNILFFE